jgi:hypothetical protein
VAGQGRRQSPVRREPRQDRSQGRRRRQEGHAKRPERESEWRTLDDEPQTDDLFDREIVQRMGPDFYRTVFAPAIREARRQGRSYEGIRDAIRKDWKPAR